MTFKLARRTSEHGPVFLPPYNTMDEVSVKSSLDLYVPHHPLARQASSSPENTFVYLRQ